MGDVMREASITRREFVKQAGQVAADAALRARRGGGSGRCGPAPVRAHRDRGTRLRHVGAGSCSALQRCRRARGALRHQPKRVVAAKAIMGAQCPTFTSFDELCDRVKPDAAHRHDRRRLPRGIHRQGADRGIDVITEKPMVIDETQCQAVLDAEKAERRRSS